MTYTLVFLALLMGSLIWWLVRQSVNVQPWVAHAGAQDVHAGAFARPAAKTALWVFLGVATSLFALFISAYAMRISLLDWSPLPQPRLLALNTAVLVAASAAMQWAVVAARRRDGVALRRALLAGGALGLAFVAGQLFVWKQLVDAGYLLATSAATGFFYLLTAVHAIHVLGGLLGWSRSWAHARRTDVSRPGAAALTLGVEMCAIYWHFLLAVWVVLFAVLASGYFGLAICTPALPL
jgi:cytochrome c oxidase subunit 3